MSAFEMSEIVIEKASSRFLLQGNSAVIISTRETLNKERQAALPTPPSSVDLSGRKPECAVVYSGKYPGDEAVFEFWRKSGQPMTGSAHNLKLMYAA